jgi:hypothetical protein
MAGFCLSPTQALVSRLSVGGFAPLLPQQRLVQSRIRAEYSDRLERELDLVATRRSNGTAVEALSHHCWPRTISGFRPLRELR